jgi:hypothetical protein
MVWQTFGASIGEHHETESTPDNRQTRYERGLRLD